VAHANDNLKARLRLLHSWREQAMRLAAQARGSKGPPRAYYIAQARQAEHYIQQLRDGERPYLDELGQRLRELLGQSQTLIARREAGRISEQDSMLVNRQLQQKVERLRGEIGALNELLGAANSTELGGFVNLDLEAYGHRLGVETPNKPSFWSVSRREMVYSFIAAGLLCGVLILYWTNLPEGYEVKARITPHPTPQLELQIINRQPYIYLFNVTEPQPTEKEGVPAQLALFVRESDGSLRLVPPVPRAWTYRGATMDTRGPAQVPPTVQAVFNVELNQLPIDLTKVARIKVNGVDMQGNTLFESWADVPESVQKQKD